MKTRFILECDEEIDFVVLAINSNKKAYKLCWNINKSLQLSFEKKKDYNIKKGFWFASYTAICDDGVKYNLLANQSKKGYLIPNQKSINFFLLIKNDFWEKEKIEFINKLRKVKDVLFVSELDLSLIKHIDRFIFDDTKD